MTRRPAVPVADRIDAAFDQAVGYSLASGDNIHDNTYDLDDTRRRRNRRGLARAIVPDDEEDATMAPGPESAHPPPDEQFRQAQTPAGGFFAETNTLQAASEENEPVRQANEEPALSYAGGFLPMEDDPGYSFTFNPGGGGFLPEPTFSHDEDPVLAPPSGGFFPPTDDGALSHSNVYNPPLSTVPTGRGFLPPLPSFDLESVSLPTPPRPRRIPIARVPAALRHLRIPRSSTREVIEMFEEVASDDEDVEGGKSIRRERFKEALEILLEDDDEDDNNDDVDFDQDISDANNDDLGSDAYGAGKQDDNETKGPSRTSRPTTRATRRSTRANPTRESADDSAGQAKATDRADESDFLDDHLASGSESSDASFSAGDNEEESRKKRKKPPRSSTSRKRKGDPAAAMDSFELFFDASPQLDLPPESRVIGLAELQRACRVLKEKFTDQDLLEMLEVAGNKTGLVDLESFSQILAETRI
ncbi:uncharacterized protein JCM15063_004305 [Sporobolomyces koalae]|uniref:uncharacterized protein n=1 Tax=Sporobolomyces koalae TaxID=500713 RepID=UPI00317B19CD